MKRRLAVVAATALVAVGAAYAGWAVYLSRPHGDAPEPADAIVVLAGADDGRHAFAERLVDAGYAANLVVSAPDGTRDRRAWALCHPDPDPTPGVERTCFRPSPATTWGEALAVQDLAGAHGWHRVLVVTNRPHTFRVRIVFAHATTLSARVVPIDRVDWPMLPIHAGWELAGLLKGRLLGHW